MAPVLVMIGVVVVAILCLVGVAAAAWFTWHGPVDRFTLPGSADAGRGISSRTTTGEAAADPAFSETSDRVVRVLTLIFLASVGIAVFVTNQYPDTAVQIEILIAAALLTIVLLQDLLPMRIYGRGHYWMEAVASTLYVAILTGLTGGASSPFFIGFLLVVAGASLSLDETAPLMIALLAGASFALVVVATTDPSRFLVVLPMLAFDLVMLALLAYMAGIVAREQRRAREAALGLSRVDPLTGMFNRAHFFSELDREIRRSARTGRRFALLMFDLDNLKPVNDLFGHPMGDELLRAITATVRRAIRGTDVAARYGGDEFIVLLADTDFQGAYTVAEKLRTDIEVLAVGSMDRPARTSASFGLATYPDDGTTIEGLVKSADDALLQAKRLGKNRIVGFVTRTERVATSISEAPPSSGNDPLPAATYVRRDLTGSGVAPREPLVPMFGPRPAQAAPSDAEVSALRVPTPLAGPATAAAPDAPGSATPDSEPASSMPPGVRPVGLGDAPWDSTASPSTAESRWPSERPPR